MQLGAVVSAQDSVCHVLAFLYFPALLLKGLGREGTFAAISIRVPYREN